MHCYKYSLMTMLTPETKLLALHIMYYIRTILQGDSVTYFCPTDGEEHRGAHLFSFYSNVMFSLITVIRDLGNGHTVSNYPS